MIKHSEISDVGLRKEIRQGKVVCGGNIKLKIYGRLNCVSGKRMKRKNRVFFIQESEAAQYGYRPCGHCMKRKYEDWKTTVIKQ